MCKLPFFMFIINCDIQVLDDCFPLLFYNTQNRAMSGAATMQVSQQSCQFNSKIIPDRGNPMEYYTMPFKQSMKRKKNTYPKFQN